MAETRGRKKGTPKTGGKVKGTPNKLGRSMRERALEYVDKALLTLVINMDSDNGSVSNTAAIALLDRAFGKPMQAVSHEGTGENGAVQLEVVIKHYGKTDA